MQGSLNFILKVFQNHLNVLSRKVKRSYLHFSKYHLDAQGRIAEMQTMLDSNKLWKATAVIQAKDDHTLHQGQMSEVVEDRDTEMAQDFTFTR